MSMRSRLAAAAQRFVHWLEEKPDFPTLTDKVASPRYELSATEKLLQHERSIDDEIERLRREPLSDQHDVGHVGKITESMTSSTSRSIATKRRRKLASVPKGRR